MDKQLETLLLGCKNDLSKNIFLLHYNYANNVCVNADPLALLPVEVKTGGSVSKLEQVADITIPRQDQFQIYLRDESNLSAVMTAVRSLHPEFLLDIVPDSIYEGQTEDENSLLYTMPPVNKERRDLLLQIVDYYYNKAKVRFESLKVEWTGNVSNALKDDADKAKLGQEKLDELFEEKTEQLNEEKESKIREIEEAYQRYLEEHPEEGNQANRPQLQKPGQEDEEVKNSLTFDESWKNS